MKLYLSPGACSLASHITLQELGLSHDIEKVDLRQHRTTSGQDFYSINPKGYVPALQLDDGAVLTEGPAILQYLADLKPEARLAPANGTIARYRLQEWLAYLNSEIHKTFGVFFTPDSTEAEKAAAGNRLARKFEWLQAQLGTRTSLMPDGFTVADAYLYTLLGWTGFVGIDLGRWPGLKAYHAHTGARPAVQAAHKAEQAA